jgi:hypothetical protein
MLPARHFFYTSNRKAALTENAYDLRRDDGTRLREVRVHPAEVAIDAATTTHDGEFILATLAKVLIR